MDSKTGYTYNFSVYTGKSENVTNGLGYVVMGLCKQIFGQGYKLFTDNFYTSVPLFQDLLKEKISACGTMILNRKGIPEDLKNTKQFNKKGSQRGKMRWVRRGNLGFLQWKDNKVVTILTTMHKNLSGKLFYKSKVNGQFRELHVPQSQAIKDYNMHMGGVDRSD